MIQRALATLLCLVGAAAIALGIASATAWRADDVLVADAQAAPGTTMLVTDPGVLDLAADSVTVTARADGGVVIVLGRAADVDAWVGGDAHTRVTGLAEWHVLATADVEAEPEPEPTDEPTASPTPAEGETAAPDPGITPTPAATETPAAPADGAAAEGAEGADAEGTGSGEPAETAAPDPSGSDLWIEEVSGTGEAELEWTAQDGRWSVLVAAVGDDPEPPAVSLAWPQVVTTPWLWPGVVVGSLLVLGGLAWWTLMLLAGRRAKRRAAVRPAVAVAAPVPVGASASGTVAAEAPLTRRQLRELEEQRSRGARTSRTGLTERFPVLVPGPRRDTGPAPDETAQRETEPSSRASAQAEATGDRPAGRRALRAAAANAPVTPATGPAPAAPVPSPTPGGPVPVSSPAAQAPAAAEQPEKRDRRFGFRARRRSDEAAPAAPAPAAPVETPTVQPVVPAATQWTPAASADAWRRAWGLPATGEQNPAPEEPGQAGAAAPPTPPDQSGEPPLRRRRDNR